MLECGLTSPEGLSTCVELGQACLKAVGDLVGLGSAALVAILIGYIRHLRQKSAHTNLLLGQCELRATNAEKAQSQFDERMSEARENIGSLTATLQEKEQQIGLLEEGTKANAGAAETLHDALELSRAGDTAFWRRPPLPLHDAGLPIQLRTSCPTIMFANQKGGVGKTTLVANIAAYLAAKGFNVLAVDLDYQGSLSNLMRLEQFGPAGPPYAPAIDVKTVLREPFVKSDWSRAQLDQAIVTAATQIEPVEGGIQPGRLCYIANDYELSQIERAVEYAWVLDSLADDPRYRLAAFLSHAAEVLKLDYVLIDAPPRFTLGFVNGLSAATDMFVPMIVDGVSGRAVETFARQFVDVAPRLNPVIKWSGIIGMMSNGTSSQLPGTQERFAESAERAARARIPSAGGFLYDAVIPRSAYIGDATDAGIPYIKSEDLREKKYIQTLGNRLIELVGNNGQPSAGSATAKHSAVSAA